MAVPFDAQRLEVVGTAVPVVENIRQSTTVGAAHFSISATGSLVYVPGSTQPDQRKLVWVSRTGVAQPLTAPLRAMANPAPRLAPDGGRLAVGGGSGGGTQSWLYDIGRERLTPFMSGPSTSNFLIWTPDGKRIAFNSNRQGPLNLFWQMADGSGGLEQLARSANPQYPLSFSPDGQLLAFAEVSPTTSYDIWILDLRDRKARSFLQTSSIEAAPRFSPDGRWLAYVSNESGRYDVWVQAYPGPGGKSLISTEGGNEPAWNPNGRELFYRNGDKMMAVDVTTELTFSAGKPRLLFERHYLPAASTIPAYDVSHDGQRFLMVEDGEPETPITQINIVLNWAEELKRLVPTK
jgi:dipeptidyl aminopeptidase/acylaminoacyl peptidase